MTFFQAEGFLIWVFCRVAGKCFWNSICYRKVREVSLLEFVTGKLGKKNRKVLVSQKLVKKNRQVLVSQKLVKKNKRVYLNIWFITRKLGKCLRARFFRIGYKEVRQEKQENVSQSKVTQAKKNNQV